MNLTLHELARVVSAKNDVSAYPNLVLKNIEFDSRLIQDGDIFLPLKGARDGHEFIPTAFDKGAVVTLSEKKIAFPHILVTNTEQAFQVLAAYYLEKTKVDVIAITGSNGKTTTKDMAAQILETTYKTYKTQGNYNNQIGLPYTVLHMPEGLNNSSTNLCVVCVQAGLESVLIRSQFCYRESNFYENRQREGRASALGSDAPSVF